LAQPTPFEHHPAVSKKRIQGRNYTSLKRRSAERALAGPVHPSNLLNLFD
jgi:hypothetical protein